jgi:hypothetical protein
MKTGAPLGNQNAKGGHPGTGRIIGIRGEGSSVLNGLPKYSSAVKTVSDSYIAGVKKNTIAGISRDYGLLGRTFNRKAYKASVVGTEKAFSKMSSKTHGVNWEGMLEKIPKK